MKWAKGVEEQLEAVKAQALSQTADIEAVFRTIDEVSAETRRVRPDLDKLVKAGRKLCAARSSPPASPRCATTSEAINATMGEHRFHQAVPELGHGRGNQGKSPINSMRRGR